MTPKSYFNVAHVELTHWPLALLFPINSICSIPLCTLVGQIPASQCRPVTAIRSLARKPILAEQILVSVALLHQLPVLNPARSMIEEEQTAEFVVPWYSISFASKCQTIGFFLTQPSLNV